MPGTKPASQITHVWLKAVTKEGKGEATLRKNESACTGTDPMQPASHHCFHTCTLAWLKDSLRLNPLVQRLVAELSPFIMLWYKHIEMFFPFRASASASGDDVMRRVYGALLVAMLVVCRVCAEYGRV